MQLFTYYHSKSFYCCLLLLFLFSSCSTQRKLVGTWKINSTQTTANTYQFKSNGTLIEQDKTNTTLIKNWDYNRKNKLLTVSQENTNQTDEYQLLQYLPLEVKLAHQKTDSSQQQLTLFRQLPVQSLIHRVAKRKLKGRWLLVQVEDSVKQTKSWYFHFYRNGIAKEINPAGEGLGEWVLSLNNKTLTISKAEQNSNFEIQFLKGRHIRLKDAYGHYTFKKRPAKVKKNLPSWKQSRLVGGWRLAKLGDQTPQSKTKLYLYEDGSFKRFVQGQIEEVGQWKLNETGEQLILSSVQQEVTYPIKSVGMQKVQLLGEFESLTFKRIPL